MVRNIDHNNFSTISGLKAPSSVVNVARVPNVGQAAANQYLL
ncbi:9847_t:CDS:2 [Funneliformis caledonium]|uniref:9847_t:CDS:1 n=1 Tax=Funneliformis caledonium TaxID=1117310 RepID=A0A9N9CLG6_9GLOM|nr:9847_t:CDS:2 [Funneliformis caledonium]